MRDAITFYLNGERQTAGADLAMLSLSRYLRYDRRATGTKIVCEEGDCGACTVLIGRRETGPLKHRPITSCTTFPSPPVRHNVLTRHRPGHDDDLLAADRDAGRDRHDRVLRPPLARHLLIRLRDMNDLRHARERADARRVDAAIIADEPHRRALCAGHGTRLVAHLLDHRDDRVDLRHGRAVLHYDQHYPSSISVDQPSLATTTSPA